MEPSVSASAAPYINLAAVVAPPEPVNDRCNLVEPVVSVVVATPPANLVPTLLNPFCAVGTA